MVSTTEFLYPKQYCKGAGFSSSDKSMRTINVLPGEDYKFFVSACPGTAYSSQDFAAKNNLEYGLAIFIRVVARLAGCNSEARW